MHCGAYLFQGDAVGEQVGYDLDVDEVSVGVGADDA